MAINAKAPIPVSSTLFRNLLPPLVQDVQLLHLLHLLRNLIVDVERVERHSLLVVGAVPGLDADERVERDLEVPLRALSRRARI